MAKQLLSGLPGALRGLTELPGRLPGMLQGGWSSPEAPQVPAPEGAQFLSRSFEGEGGRLAYRLYIPARRGTAPMPLVVMLHGCTQSAEDFAAGTRMNQLAEEKGFLVAYPAQSGSANMQRCWNWFRPGDQQRDAGEPGLIAGMAREILRQDGADPRRVYVAGLSAGGAAAAILAARYPDLFAAAGVHSGLGCGAARDLPSALSAMRQGAPDLPSPAGTGTRLVPTIVFHADGDSTVNPRNGDQIIEQLQRSLPVDWRMRVEEGRVPNGHAWRRTLYADGSGRHPLEQWLVHGGGHAWSGGSPDGSYTDPKGPDASREMLRFFLEHPLGQG
jgi:poly(hydroxyalkanoate) depolymerase family esterase